MTEKTVFVIRNQLGQYLDKHSGWQSGRDNNALFRVDHRDEALNTLIEINAKDISLRGKILEVPADEKKRPLVEISEEALALDKARTGESSEIFSASDSSEDQGSAEGNDTEDDNDAGDDSDIEEIIVMEELQITLTGENGSA